MSATGNDKTSAIVEHLGCRLHLVFSYFFFSVEFKKDKKFIEEFLKACVPTMRGLGIITIQAACLNTTLMAIRDLDEFFQSRTGGTRLDDLRASDLGYDEGLAFLTKTERGRINKIIMHSTVGALEDTEASWDIGELTSKCISQSVHFLNWVKTNYSDNHAKTREAAELYIILIERVLKHAEKIKHNSGTCLMSFKPD
jgi:hypothetical protein